MPAERMGGNAAVPAAWARAYTHLCHPNTSPPAQVRDSSGFLEKTSASQTWVVSVPFLLISTRLWFRDPGDVPVPPSFTVPQCHCLGSMCALLWVHLAVSMLALPPITGELLQFPRDVQVVAPTEELQS